MLFKLANNGLQLPEGAGDSPQMLIKSTKVPLTKNLSLEYKTPPFG